MVLQPQKDRGGLGGGCPTPWENHGQRSPGTPLSLFCPLLSGQVTTDPVSSLCPSLLTAEVLVTAGRGGLEGDRGGRQPRAGGGRHRAAV